MARGLPRNDGGVELTHCKNKNKSSRIILQGAKMEKVKITNFLLGTFWTGWRRWAAWSICVSAIFLLGELRTVTDADFTFASLAILPVLVIAWIGGKRNGLLVAFLAAAMWTMADMVSERQFSTQWIQWTNAVTRLITYSLVALLAAQVRLQFEREHEHATRDVLTGLTNRRAFLEEGAAEVERSKRYAHPLAVIFLDLDDFKQLNDTKGHDAGDAALRATARALLGALRSWVATNLRSCFQKLRPMQLSKQGGRFSMR